MSLLAAMDDGPDEPEFTSFRPEQPGESVEGTVVTVSSTTSDYTSTPVPVVTVRTDDGELRQIRGYHSHLNAELSRLPLLTGDRLAVRFDGRKKTRDGAHKFCMYTVRHRSSNAS